GLARAPTVAALRAGNRTQEVRIDILAQEIAVAPGVRFVAWTFGGAVPGPVLHVREGDRVDFTVTNRSGEALAITEPMPGGAPFLAEIARSDYQAARAAEDPVPHSLDFHSATVAADDKWRTIP